MCQEKVTLLGVDLAGVGAKEESLWMNPHRNSKRFWSSGRKEKNSKTLLGCILSIMSAEKLGSGPRSFALSPGVCFSLGGVGFSLWWVISFSPFTFQAALRWQISLTGLGHRHENLSYWANRVSAEESIYGGENGGVWGMQKFWRAQLCIQAQTGWPRCCPPPQTLPLKPHHKSPGWKRKVKGIKKCV